MTSHVMILAYVLFREICTGQASNFAHFSVTVDNILTYIQLGLREQIEVSQNIILQDFRRPHDHNFTYD